MNKLPEIFNEILGKYVKVPETPKRIISFSPAITESIFMLGMGDSIAAVSAFCVRPKEAREKRRIGSYNTVREELLESIKPDLIFTVTGYQREFAIKLSNKFPVYPIELPVSLTGIMECLMKLGLVLNREDEARKIIKEQIAILDNLKANAKKLKVYVEIDLGGPVTFGAYSYITDALAFLGCENIYGKIRAEWIKPEIDRVPMEEPDVFIYEAKMFSEFSEKDLIELIKKRGWQNQRFFINGNFFLTPGPMDFLAHHGPSFISEAMPWLANNLNIASAKT